jgi:hypothetical protein
MTPMGGAGRRPLTRLTTGVLCCSVAASLLLGCTSARSDLGTSDSSCYIALPTATRAVGSHGRLIGVHLSTLAALRRQSPALFDVIPDQPATTQRICIVAFMGSFTSPTVAKPVGRASGSIAVVISEFPSNALLGTVITDRPPPHVGHSHIG